MQCAAIRMFRPQQAQHMASRVLSTGSSALLPCISQSLLSQVNAPGVAHHMPHPPSSCCSELPEGAPPIVHHHSVLGRDAQGIGGGTKGGGGGQHERQAGAGCRVGNARQVKEACARDAPNLVGKCSEACSREGWRGPCLLQPHMLETRSFSRRVKRAQRQRPALAPTSHLARWGATLHPAT